MNTPLDLPLSGPTWRGFVVLVVLVGVSVGAGAITSLPIGVTLLLPAYLVVGYGAGLVSCAVVNVSTGPCTALTRLGAYASFLRRNETLIYEKFWTACIEEGIYRVLPVIVVALTGLSPWWLLLPATLFTLQHVPRRGTIYVWNLVELQGFSLGLTYALYAWPDPSLVVIVHLLRNANFVYLVGLPDLQESTVP